MFFYKNIPSLKSKLIFLAINGSFKINLLHLYKSHGVIIFIFSLGFSGIEF